MPYISKKQRVNVDGPLEGLYPFIETPGEMNYAVCKLMLDFLQFHGESYTTYNSIIGILECVKQEFYRRMIAKYEDKKIEENGDIF